MQGTWPTLVVHSRAKGIPASRHAQDALFWTLLALAGLLAFIRMAYPNELNELAWVWRRWGYNQQLLRELSVGIPFGWVLLNGFAVIVASLYIALLAGRLYRIPPDALWQVVLMGLAAITALLAARYFFIQLAAVALPDARPLRFFLYYEFQLLRVAGLLLFPLIIVMAFATEPVQHVAYYVSYGVLIVLFVVRMAKGLSVGSPLLLQRPLLFLLYLCALEIAPLLVLVRIFLNAAGLSVDR